MLSGNAVARIPSTVGEHLRRFRAQHALEQKDIASKLGVSTVTLSRWEWDKGEIKPNHRKLIIQLLEYDPFVNLTDSIGSGNETYAIAFLLTNEPEKFRLLLRKTRIRKNLLQWEVAELLGVDQKTVNNWEKGRSVPIRNHHERIMQYLKFGDELCQESINNRMRPSCSKKMKTKNVGLFGDAKMAGLP